MDLIITKQLYYNLLLAREELRDEVFRLLASVVLREPLGHDVVGLLPVLHHLLEVLLTLIRKIGNITEKCPALTRLTCTTSMSITRISLTPAFFLN